MDPETFRDSPFGRMVRASARRCDFVPAPLSHALPRPSDQVLILPDAVSTLGRLERPSHSPPNPHLLICCLILWTAGMLYPCEWGL
jgi:hypothetical protein